MKTLIIKARKTSPLERHLEKGVVRKSLNMGMLPCPGCQSYDVVLKGSKDPETEVTRFDRVQCMSCGITGPWFDGHPGDAVAFWNEMPRGKCEACDLSDTCKATCKGEGV